MVKEIDSKTATSIGVGFLILLIVLLVGIIIILVLAFQSSDKDGLLDNMLDRLKNQVLNNTNITTTTLQDGSTTTSINQTTTTTIQGEPINDSDGGDNYYERGNANGSVDYCTDVSGTAVWAWNVPSIYLKEYYVENNEVKSFVVECPAPDVCLDGRCIDVRNQQHCIDSDGIYVPGGTSNVYTLDDQVKGTCNDILGTTITDYCPETNKLYSARCVKSYDKDLGLNGYESNQIDIEGAIDNSHWMYICSYWTYNGGRTCPCNDGRCV